MEKNKKPIVNLYKSLKSTELFFGVIVLLVVLVISLLAFGITIKSGLLYYLPITLLFFKFRRDIIKGWDDRIKKL